MADGCCWLGCVRGAGVEGVARARMPCGDEDVWAGSVGAAGGEMRKDLSVSGRVWKLHRAYVGEGTDQIRSGSRVFGVGDAERFEAGGPLACE